jgi:hypothetical protein
MMTKSEIYTLRMNILGGMDAYIRDVIGDDEVTEIWNDDGIEDGIDEDVLLDYARDDEAFKQICYLFGTLMVGY